MPERRIISASRRTDIPAHYAEWLLRRLEAGFCDYRHPFSRRWFRVSLRPEDVAAMVLWTKNLAPLLPHLHTVRARFPFYVQFTITGHPPELEPGVIAAEEAVRQAREVSGRFGPDALVWRFDPIVNTQLGGPEETVRRFCDLAARLEGATERCVISFMSPYRRQARAFSRAGLQWHEPSPALRHELSARLARIAADHAMTLAACCNDDIVTGEVSKAHCVDADLLRRLGADLPAHVPPGPSRDQCGCARSVDIGAYDLCPAGCVYCYANQDPATAQRNYARHDAGHVALAEAVMARVPPEA